MIRDRLTEAIRSALVSITDAPIPNIDLERPARREHGDWSTNIALVMSKAVGQKPRDLAQSIIDHLEQIPELTKVEIAGPGFINFSLHGGWLTSTVRDVIEAGADWGRFVEPKPLKINVEFVSANPTGPLHIGHARWAAVGDGLASVLEAAGHSIVRESYINDFGRQMDLFGESIAARYLKLFGVEKEIPQDGYHGNYVIEIAQSIKDKDGDRWVPADESERIEAFRELGMQAMLDDQRTQLQRFGVRFDVWFSEATLHESGAVETGLARLTKGGHTFVEDGALWVRTTDFFDDKDRVAKRADGTTTYMAADVAYYLDKKARGFDRLIYLIGADHHGYVQRMNSIIAAIGDKPEETEFLIGQLVNLTRSGEPVRMSKRTGEFVTFEELIDEVGVDAARYTFLRQSSDTSMEFDIDLVINQSQENPVFYVQYAHARICSILRVAQERGVTMKDIEDVELEALHEEAELDLIRKIGELPEIVEVSSRLRAPHRIPRYAEELAAQFHAFYRDCRVVSDDEALTQARLQLCVAARTTLANALRLLGVSAPEKMERIGEGQ
ncbi:MAG: arginine--tRNA ligase [Actinomycetota bacterium]